MSEQNANTNQPAPATPQVESPPVLKLVDKVVDDARGELRALAAEVVRKGSRRLLWEYLRLRSRVLGK